MADFKQWQRVILNPEITGCPGNDVVARILSINHDKQEAFVQVLYRCDGCDCGPDLRSVKLKNLEVAHGNI